MRVRRYLVLLVLFAGLLALSSRAADKAESSLLAEYERIHKAFEAEQQAFSEASRKAKTDEEREKLKFPDREKYAGQMLALAEKHPKDPQAIRPLLWVLNMDRQNSPHRPKALTAIMTHHLENEELAEVCATLGEEEDESANDFLKDVLAKSPHQKVKGAAGLALGQIHASENPAEAEKYYNEVIANYGTKSQKETARSELFAMKHLAIGKVAPEIEGEDVDGTRFKLSDYRGKVVMLTFWGDW